MAGDAELLSVIRAIAAGDESTVLSRLAEMPALATQRVARGATRQSPSQYFLDEIKHHIYAGDTALHLASAGYRPAIIRELLALGADVHAANRRGAQPLHYAVDGGPGSLTWNPPMQRDTVVCLLDAGADPNAVDKGGVTPLHRAVRNRCAAAVDALLQGGADPRRPNGRGSTPAQLACWTTGRGGSGLPQARAQQEEIAGLLRRHGSP